MSDIELDGVGDVDDVTDDVVSDLELDGVGDSDTDVIDDDTIELDGDELTEADTEDDEERHRLKSERKVILMSPQ